MHTLEQISEKVRKAKPLDFGDVFNQSIELFKKSWLYGFLFQIIIQVLALPFIVIFYIPFVLALVAQSESGQLDSGVYSDIFAGLTGVSLIFFILGVLVLVTIQLALQAGLFRIIKNIDYGHEVKASDLFYFFKGKYFGSVALLMVAIIVVGLIASLLCLIPLIYAIIPMSYFVIVFAFNPTMSTVDIVKASFILGTKKWLLSFGLFLVIYLIIVVLIFLTCGLGSLFFPPFIYLPLYIIYREVVGFEKDNPINHIVE